MIRYTLPRIVRRHLDKCGADGRLKDGETRDITDNDLAFAELIGDYLMFISIYQWGNALIEALDNELVDNKPRKKQSKLIDLYARFPKTFTKDDLTAFYENKNTIRVLISRLLRAKVIKKLKDGSYTKLVESIADIVTY